MPRTAVYDTPPVQRHYRAIVRKEAGAARPNRTQRKAAQAKAVEEVKNGVPPPAPPAPPDGASPTTGQDVPGTDDYLSKIAKYVPAETIAIVTLGFGLWDPAGNWVWFWLGVAAVANIVYLYATALADPNTIHPRTYFYVLSIVALAAWATATISDVQNAIGLDPNDPDLVAKTGFILSAAVFIIPALDTIFSRTSMNSGQIT